MCVTMCVTVCVWWGLKEVIIVGQQMCVRNCILKPEDNGKFARKIQPYRSSMEVQQI